MTTRWLPVPIRAIHMTTTVVRPLWLLVRLNTPRGGLWVVLHLITFTKYMTAENVIVAEIFVTADTHFYHSGILKHGRGQVFESEEAMTAALVQNWVANVPKNSIVYHLGDF